MRLLIILGVFLLIGYAGWVVFKGFAPRFEKIGTEIETEPYAPSDTVPAPTVGY